MHDTAGSDGPVAPTLDPAAIDDTAHPGGPRPADDTAHPGGPGGPTGSPAGPVDTRTGPTTSPVDTRTGPTTSPVDTRTGPTTSPVGTTTSPVGTGTGTDGGPRTGSVSRSDGAPAAHAVPEAGDGGPPGLAPLGLAPGDRVRWRDRKSTRWREGRVVARERDGSVGVRDARGASRALRLERLEVRDRGPRGGVVWEPLPDRAARTEQLGLWGAEPGQPPAPG